MLFVIRFTDHQDRKELRDKHLASHISWLSAQRATVKVAGSLRHELAQTPVGAMWIVQAESRHEADEIYKTDPFWLAGLRRDVEILHWSKAFPDEEVPV